MPGGHYNHIHTIHKLKSTIMIKSVMYHKVQDFATWKKAFDGFSEFRKSSGELSFSVGNVKDEPNTAYVINSWDSVDKLHAFVTSKELEDAMKSAGVLEPPHTLILNELDKG
jgi:quinol monooxygenase YgiN